MPSPPPADDVTNTLRLLGSNRSLNRPSLSSQERNRSLTPA